MSTKSALRADLDAGERKTLAEDRKRMECSSVAHAIGAWRLPFRIQLVHARDADVASLI
jgi:hypothetical protein